MPTRGLGGTPSDQLPAVLAAGSTDVTMTFVSLSAREPDGRDAEYLEWHSLDHRPEQYRVAGLRHSLRLVSTPACRAHRAVSEARYDATDHVMIYFWTSEDSLAPFGALSDALAGDRRGVSLPSVAFGTFRLVGKVAAPRVAVGADVLPWRPALGAYLLIEQGEASPPGPVVEVDGVAGAWWHRGLLTETPFTIDSRGLVFTILFLDDDPVAVAHRLRGPLEERWSRGDTVAFLAAPFHLLVPFAWDRYLP
jgi:hypothetical protein